MFSIFESDYETEEQVITVLLKDKCNGGIVLEKEYIKPSVTFVAAINSGSDEMIKKEGRIEWLLKKKAGEVGFGYDFKQYGIYKLLVRKCIQKQPDSMLRAEMNNRYMLVKVLEEDVKNQKLEELKEHLSRPVMIDTEFATFKLDRTMAWFEATANLGGFEVTVYLETDEDNEETANNALAKFKSIASEFEIFDKKNKEASADFLLELANDWLEDDDREDKPEEITKEMFIDAINISEISIAPAGSMTLYYSDGDMFWGHVITMDIETDGSCSDAYIQG